MPEELPKGVRILYGVGTTLGVAVVSVLAFFGLLFVFTLVRMVWSLL